MLNLENYADFDSASAAVLLYLQGKLGFELWMTTRVSDPHWIVLNTTADNQYGINSGDVLRWSDSYCSRMIRGDGPNFAPKAGDIAAYSEAPINDAVFIQSYVGVPILMSNGKLFGTLCAIDTEEKSPGLESEMVLVKIFANLLGLVAERDIRLQERERALDEVRNESQRDKLTGLYNRRGWDFCVKEQELQSHSYASPVSILILDLDELKTTNDTLGHQAGDQMIIDAATSLKSVIRPTDVVARIGGDEFAVLTTEITQEGGEALCNRVLLALKEQGVKASIGFALHDPRDSLADTVHAADEAMYEMKIERRKRPNMAAASLQSSISYLHKQRNAVTSQARSFKDTSSFIVRLVASR